MPERRGGDRRNGKVDGPSILSREAVAEGGKKKGKGGMDHPTPHRTTDDVAAEFKVSRPAVQQAKAADQKGKSSLLIPLRWTVHFSAARPPHDAARTRPHLVALVQPPPGRHTTRP